MEILKVASFGIAAMIFIMVISEQHKTTGMALRVIAGTIMLLYIVPQLRLIFEVIYNLADKISLQSSYLWIVFKIIGIAYIAEFAYQICKDGGEESIANKVQLAGKVMILVLAAPIALALIDLITQLL